MQCTPGRRGADDARRVAVVEREVDAVDLQREQRPLVGDLVCGERRAREDAVCLERDVPDGRRSAGAQRARPSSRTGTPVQRWVVDQPSTQAIGRS